MAVRRAWNTLTTAIGGFGGDDGVILSAALAFYAILSLAPLLILLVTGTSLLGEDTQQRVVHMKRIAQLNRLRELAQQKGDQNMIARIDKLIAQENKVYDRKLGKMEGRAGGAMPPMNPPGAKGKADVNKPAEAKPPAQAPPAPPAGAAPTQPAPAQEKAGEAAKPPAGQSNQPKPQ